MGTPYRAVCKCGYQSEELLEGVGFDNGLNALAYYDNCEEVSSVNIKSEQLVCTRCNGELKLYNNDSFTGNETDIEISKKWHCPRCKQKQLKFETAGL